MNISCFKKIKYYRVNCLFIIFLICISIVNAQSNHQQIIISSKTNTISSLVKLPEHFKRLIYDSGSYQFYIQHLPLKEQPSEVYYYNGLKKEPSFHYAVFDISTGKKNLQQCADAIIRIRAEYLFSQKKYDEISFHFTNGFKADFTKWKKGFRIKVEGNDVRWYNTNESDSSFNCFMEYLEMVFMYSGSFSLSKELKQKSINDIEPGDVFIQGGTPGHAVLVADVAVNEITGERIFLIGQGFMPAQSIHILKNPNNSKISPWYSNNISESLQIPEWTFFKSDFMSFK